MPAIAVDAPHTTARASARLAEVGPSCAPRLSCVLEDLESGAIRVALDGELVVVPAPAPVRRIPELDQLYGQLETTDQAPGERREREAA